MKKFAWSHENGGLESTNGVRLEISGATGDMITVVYPGNEIPLMKPVKNGVMVGDDIITFVGDELMPDSNAEIVKVTRRGQLCLNMLKKEIDFNRWQGDVGLFIPDAGYPFGDIPEWLIKQRSAKPKWAENI